MSKKDDKSKGIDKTRRKFLAGSAAAGLAIPVVAKGANIYGTPESVTGPIKTPDSELLRLQLSKSGLPSSTWNLLDGLGSVWKDLFEDKSKAKKFVNNPKAYLKSKGIPESVISSDDREVKMMEMLLDETINRHVVNGDYNGFLNEITSRGLIKNYSSSKLKSMLEDILKNDSKELRKVLGEVSLGEGESIDSLVENDDFQTLCMQLLGDSSSTNQIASTDGGDNTDLAFLIAGVVVIIAAAVLIYVSVGTTVTVAITAGVTISVAVAVAVVAAGDTEKSTNSQLSTFIDQQSVANPYFSTLNQLIELDPVLKGDSDRALRLAGMLKSKDFMQKGVKQVVGQEIKAIFDATISTGLLKVDVQNKEKMINAAQNIVYKSLNLES